MGRSAFMAARAPLLPLPVLARPPRPPSRAPFFRDPAHTVPVKWDLYRPLLKAFERPACAAVMGELEAGLGGSSSTASASGSRSGAAAVPNDAPTVTTGSSGDAGATPSPRTTSPTASPATPSPSGGWTVVRLIESPPRSVSIRAPARPSSTPFPALLAETRARWRKARKLTSIPRARGFLEREEALLSDLVSGSPDAAARVAYLEQRAMFRLEQRGIVAAAAAAVKKHPRLTGGFMRPTLHWPPMPRLKPQPEKITMMINRRVDTRERRIHKQRDMAESVESMKAELAFWDNLGIGPETPGYGPWATSPQSWERDYLSSFRDLTRSFYAFGDRIELKFDQETIAKVKNARRRRHAWKTEMNKRKEVGLKEVQRLERERDAKEAEGGKV